LHYLWKIEEQKLEEARDQVETICQLGDSIVALGWGRDLVVGYGRTLDEKQAADLKGTHFVPDPVGDVYLSIPYKGLLDEVLGRYEEGRRRESERFAPPVRVVPVERAKYSDTSRTLGPKNHFDAFSLEGPQGEKRPSFRGRDIATVAMWLVNTLVSEGLSLRREVLFVPLPTISPRYADGRIRRLIVVQPLGEKKEDFGVSLAGRSLTDKHGKIQAFLHPLPLPDNVLSLYVATSDTWTTVTPTIVCGYQNERFTRDKAEEYIMEALADSGYRTEMIEEIWYQRSPLWRGSYHVRDYYLPPDLADRRSYHIGVKFRVPVRGPVLAGLGQRYGLGIFASLHKID
jgi:hypothetical protein